VGLVYNPRGLAGVTTARPEVLGVLEQCLAHIINLMLKTIGEFLDHESVIDSAKLIARWVYNHEKLYMIMKNAIGGNLVRWNPTCFAMNYLFLKSFLRRKDHFM
jgi:hypothetical protein